ncbi:hypothetical protein QP162_22135 [Sphingomonas aurantiaca]|uniref:hypothetical protein n=1 Tax=Sphingomonas aurantiaca TaxID=185949 RepID=UPI002FE02CC3
MPQGSLFPLPRSVENRAILRALAAAKATPLAVRSTFAPAAEVRSIDATTAIDWLAALEDLLEMPGDVGDQANATVAAIIAAGPSLAELSENERARHLRVIRARRVGSDDYELLTLSELTELSASGRLFSSQPGELLRKLAAAVPDDRLFLLRLTEESAAAGKLRLQSPSSTGAAAAILRTATTFRGVHERGNLLAELVRDDGVDKQVLRSLCVAEPLSAVTWLQLLSLGNLPAAFVDMTTEAIVSEPLRRIVPQAIADHLSNSSRDRLGISDLGVELAATMVVAAHKDGRLRPRSDDEAQSILRSGLDWEVLARLPIFRSARQGLVAIDAPLFRDGDFAVPPSMRTLVAVSEPWPDLVLKSIQARIPVWTAREQVAIALQQPEPTMFASEILDGIAMLDDRELSALRTSLRTTAWIPSASGAALRGEDIISLDVTVDAELRAALPDAAFTPYDQLPALIRDHPVAGRVRSQVFASTAESLEALALQLDAEPDLIGCVVDPIGNLEDLRTLARRDADLALPGWPLLAALLRTVSDTSSCHGIASSMTGSPSPSALASHLNAVALHAGMGTLGEAAVRLHRAAFAACGYLLLDENLFVPCDVMLPSRSSVFRRADALAVSGHGLSPQHTLESGYAETLRRTALEALRADAPSPEIMITVSDPDVVRANFARTMGALIEPWRRAVPSDAIVFVLGLLGRDRWMEVLAAEWEADTRSGSFADIWNALDDALAPELGVDDLQAVLGQTLFTAHVVTESVEVQSAAGTICVVPLETDHASLVVGNPYGSRRRVVDASGTVWHHIDIAFVVRPPSGLQADRPLFEALVELICPTIMLALPGQKSIVSAAFSQSFRVAQATIEHTIAKLRDQAPTLVRTLVLPEGEQCAMHSPHSSGLLRSIP